jgi:hypothetical protein
MFEINHDAAFFWCDAINFNFEYLVAEHDHIIALLEKNGYIVTTERDFKTVNIRILGINYNRKIACVNKCFIDK